MELFKKIFIKNSEDLPKDDKPYICHVKTSNETGHLSWLPVKDNEGIWEMVDWYHQPTEIKFPSEEEISHILDKIQDLSSREREEFYDVITGTINWIKENNIIKDEDNPNLSETL